MNVKLEIILICFGGILRIIDIGSDIWYVLTQEFNSIYVFYAFIGSLVAPSGILVLVYITVVIADSCKGHSFSCFKLVLFTLFIIGDSIGANYFVFAGVLCNTTFFSGDFYIVDGMFRASSLINSLFQSTPQIVLQVYNNQQVDNWSILTIVSIGSSALSMLYTCTKLVYSLDKMQQYEIASADFATYGKRDVKVSNVTTSRQVKSASAEDCNNDDIYDNSKE